MTTTTVFDCRAGIKSYRQQDEDFLLRCPDGRVRRVADRAHCGFTQSANINTRKLWWHDLVDWSQVGLGSALRDWTIGDSPWSCAKSWCILPAGHVGYLRLGHTRRKHG